MKKLYMMLCIMISLLITSCASNNQSISSESTDLTDTVEISNENTKNDQTGTGNEFSETSDVSSNTNPDNYIESEPPHILQFDSFEEMQRFTVAALGTKAEYDKYDEENGVSRSLINYDMSKVMASYISGTEMFKVKPDVSVEYFGAAYYYEYDELHVLYRVDGDGVLYRFIYYFNSTDRSTYGGKVALNNVSIGNLTFDLYQRDDRLVGAVMNGSTRITISTVTDNPEIVDFNNFVFELPLQKTKISDVDTLETSE